MYQGERGLGRKEARYMAHRMDGIRPCCDGAGTNLGNAVRRRGAGIVSRSRNTLANMTSDAVAVC